MFGFIKAALALRIGRGDGGWYYDLPAAGGGNSTFTGSLRGMLHSLRWEMGYNWRHRVEFAYDPMQGWEDYLKERDARDWSIAEEAQPWEDID